jgi:Xaa-Pro aminopeptidase
MSEPFVITPKRLRDLSQVYPVGLLGTRAPEVFRARREAVLAKLDCPAVVAGPDHEPGSENLWHFPGARIFQDPEILYLCGINQAGVRLLLDPATERKEMRAVLFLPPKNPAREFWDGVHLGLPALDDPGFEAALEEVKALTGFDAVLPLDDFRPTLEALVALRRLGTVGFHFHSHPDGKGRFREVRTDGTWQASRQLARWLKPLGARLVSVTATLLETRLVLDPLRIREVERAQKWTGDAFCAILPQLPAMRSERELTARLDGEMCARSPWGLAFPTICASGRNACTLHYMKNDEDFAPGSLVLLDFGCKSAGLNADISRTVPVSGRFSPLQRLVYGIVLECQKHAESLAAPGVTIRTLNRLVWQKMEDLLQERILSRGGHCERAYVEGALAPLPGKSKAHPCQPHGLSHLIAEAEHDGDPFRLYQDEPLREGWMLSNEPGLYGHFRMRLDGKLHDEWIGVRIEDDLLVTAKGVRNLSRSIPKELDELERLMGGAA